MKRKKSGLLVQGMKQSGKSLKRLEIIFVAIIIQNERYSGSKRHIFV